MADVLRKHQTVGTSVVNFAMQRDKAFSAYAGPTNHTDARKITKRGINKVAVLHGKQANAGDLVYFTVDGSTPTAKGDNTHVAVPGTPVIVPVPEGNTVTVKAIGSAAAQEVSVWVVG